MAALAERLCQLDGPREDHYVNLRGVKWADYERLVAIRGERSVPRITYLEGTLELMSPSPPHESIAATIGRLVEVWCLEHGVEFSAVGSWTIKRKREEGGAEPDECYLFGPWRGRERPDLVIEVAWTRGGIDKLEVYPRLGVREVWYWRDGSIEAYRLRGKRYHLGAASEVMPGIDVEQLASFIDRPTTSQSMRDYRAALQAGRSATEQ